MMLKSRFKKLNKKRYINVVHIAIRMNLKQGKFYIVLSVEIFIIGRFINRIVNH